MWAYPRAPEPPTRGCSAAPNSLSLRCKYTPVNSKRIPGRLSSPPYRSPGGACARWLITGSHRLVAPFLGDGGAFLMPRVRAVLAAHPWLRGLWEPGHGDVVLMHSDCFHAPAPNRRAEPRMMLTGMIDSVLPGPEQS